MERPFELLGLRIKEVRERAGYTVPDVCRILGISKAYYYKVEKGNIKPSALLSFALSELYEVEVTKIDEYIDYSGLPGFKERRL